MRPAVLLGYLPIISPRSFYEKVFALFDRKLYDVHGTVPLVLGSYSLSRVWRVGVYGGQGCLMEGTELHHQRILCPTTKKYRCSPYTRG